MHLRLFVESIERRGVTSHHHCSTISGWQQNQRWRRQKENGEKVKGFYWQNNTFACASCYFAHFFAVVARLQHKTPYFHMLTLWSRWTQHKSCLFPLLHLDTVLSDSTWENFANICQIKWNWIRSMKFEAVWIHCLRNVFGLLSSKNFATLTTWRNDISPLLGAQNKDIAMLGRLYGLGFGENC